jgi:hypothetical protein
VHIVALSVTSFSFVCELLVVNDCDRLLNSRSRRDEQEKHLYMKLPLPTLILWAIAGGGALPIALFVTAIFCWILGDIIWHSIGQISG